MPQHWQTTEEYAGAERRSTQTDTHTFLIATTVNEDEFRSRNTHTHTNNNKYISGNPILCRLLQHTNTQAKFFGDERCLINGYEAVNGIELGWIARRKSDVHDFGQNGKCGGATYTQNNSSKNMKKLFDRSKHIGTGTSTKYGMSNYDKAK